MKDADFFETAVLMFLALIVWTMIVFNVGRIAAYYDVTEQLETKVKK